MAYLGNSPLNALFNLVPTVLTQGQTSVDVNYTPGRCLFFKNGALLENNIDYTATTGSYVTLLKSASQGDVLQGINLSSFNVANALPLSGGQMSGPLTGPMSATETIAGLMEIATQAEVNAGSDTVRAITPKTLTGSITGNIVGPNGWIKLHNGFILQWGSFFASASAGSPVTAVFPIGFPTGVLNIILSNANGYNTGVVSWNSPTLTGFNGFSSAASNSMSYMAYGK